MNADDMKEAALTLESRVMGEGSMARVVDASTAIDEYTHALTAYTLAIERKAHPAIKERLQAEAMYKRARLLALAAVFQPGELPTTH